MHGRIGWAWVAMVLGVIGTPVALAETAAPPPACPVANTPVSLVPDPLVAAGNRAQPVRPSWEAPPTIPASVPVPWRWVVTYTGASFPPPGANNAGAARGCLAIRVIQRPLPASAACSAAYLSPSRCDPNHTHEIVAIAQVKQPERGSGDLAGCQADSTGLLASARDETGCWWLKADNTVWRFVPLASPCTVGLVAGTCDADPSSNNATTAEASPGNSASEGRQNAGADWIIRDIPRPPPLLANIPVRVP